MNKSELPKKYQGLYDYNKQILTDEAFAIWYDNALNANTTPPAPLPANYMRTQKTGIAEAVSAAREAVSGYSDSNGAKKAVEALAQAVEQLGGK